jgi:quercetin dioxygenase-like cupin family protein
MKMKTKVLIGVGAVAVGAGVALATPIVGLLSPILAAGTNNHDLHARGRAQVTGSEPFHVEFETEGPSTLSTQDASIAAGGQNGWHSHPGMVVVTILSGSITWYDENCNPTDYKAGDSWVEGSQVHAFRVTSTVPFHGIAWFITAQGQPLRTDQPAPPCAAGLGL